MFDKRRLSISLLLVAAPLLAADPPPPVTDEAVDAIVQQIEAGRYQDALAAAKKAMSAYKPQPSGKNMDKTFVRLLDCCAAASLGQKQFKAAQLAAAQAFNSGFKGRSITMHLAQAEAQLKTEVVHAANIMRDFCEAHPEDVEAFGLFGATLDRARQNRITTRVIDPLIARYNTLLPKIEATKPGFKRWGADWVTRARYADLKGEQDLALGRIERQKKVVADAEAVATKRQKELKQADWNNGQLRPNQRQPLDEYHRRINAAQRVVAREREDLEKLQNDVPPTDFSAAFVITPPEADVKGS